METILLITIVGFAVWNAFLTTTVIGRGNTIIGIRNNEKIEETFMRHKHKIDELEILSCIQAAFIDGLKEELGYKEMCDRHGAPFCVGFEHLDLIRETLGLAWEKGHDGGWVKKTRKYNKKK